MKKLFRYAVFLIGLVLPALVSAQLDSPISHELQVLLQPEQQRLVVNDKITFPQTVESLTLKLHAGLEPGFSSPQGNVESRLASTSHKVETWILDLPPGASVLQVDYQGSIHQALGSSRAEQARGFRSTTGIIDPDGVYLSAASYWYPHLANWPYMVFSLDVSLPEGWSSVSQGTHTSLDNNNENWQVHNPQEEIYLIAAEFQQYSQKTSQPSGEVLAQVFLRKPDPTLASKYLDATRRYLTMYEQLLGSYPYSKFALVENFWETGYGMPSFTLLGSKVIRLPFILNSSYPHEILHNWWGNGVYVDFATGNWSEGLTAYLADHLIKEQQGQGAAYRQQSLQKYRDYAASNRDFPLNQFRSRHSSATEAVGYGKTMMMFHMLRKKLGDERFVQGLQKLYNDFQFRIAGFSDVQAVFESVAKQSLERFFTQWVERTGAPELVLRQTAITPSATGYQLELTVEQVQQGPAYSLDIPIAVTLQDTDTAELTNVLMTQKRQSFSVTLPSEPLRIDIDPQFDLFRKLAVTETPPAYTSLFGAPELFVILPSDSDSKLKTAWEAFATDLSHMGPEKTTIVWDSEIDSLPEDAAVVLLGWKNRFTTQVQTLMERHPAAFSQNNIQLDANSAEKSDHAFALVTRRPNSSGYFDALALITTDDAAALPGLGRKLPHYHKYSYLGFAGEEPENRIKGRWPVTDSPLSRNLRAGQQLAKIPQTTALIDPVSAFNTQRLLETVRTLSDTGLEGRGLGTEGLEKAATLIADAFAHAGLQVGGDNSSFFQPFTASDQHGNPVELKNVVGIIPGTHPTLKDQTVVIGAHYDHLGLGWPDVREENRGQVHPGADDNASGVAVMIELAEILGKSLKPARTLVFVAFSGEEAGRLGSMHYVKNITTPVFAMLNLDSVGRLQAKKLMVLGGESASEWQHIFRGIGFITGIQSSMVREPLDASDQISFHEAGIPAVQLFTGAHADYHRPGDTADKIDGEGLVKVAEVSQQVLEYLLSREDPLNVQLGSHSRNAAPGKSRKVSLGSIPDFTYEGEGYRLDGVMPDSPAQAAGLAKMDVITAIDGQAVKGLRDVSKILKSLKPGQTITINYRRNGSEQQTKANLTSK